jgi:hypothetical protein
VPVTGFSPDTALASAELQQLETSIEALNVRIARLAIALGLSLQSEEDVAKVMQHHAALAPRQERRGSAVPSALPRTDSSIERRTAHTWEELRGLLVLRYDVQRHCVDQVGVTAARNILAGAEESLLRKGFKRGDDGIDLEHLFNDP